MCLPTPWAMRILTIMARGGVQIAQRAIRLLGAAEIRTASGPEAGDGGERDISPFRVAMQFDESVRKDELREQLIERLPIAARPAREQR